MSARSVSRRDFLKGIGVGSAALSAAWLLDGKLNPVFASAGGTGPIVGMLIDLTRCVGCDSCALACRESNDLPHPDTVPDALETDSFTCIEEHWVTSADGTAEQRFVKRQCMHCLNAACVAACPAAAMYKGDQGQVIYRPYRCLGCRYCQAACPFGIPRFNWDNPFSPVINKCQMCYDRLQQGGEPACEQACPSGALRFGLRNELLAQAHARIASNPDRYIDHVYGEFEVGGTSMLYLSDVQFEQLGFPADLPQTAPPEQTEKIVTKLPFVLAGMTALMAGTSLYTSRRHSRSIPESDAQEQTLPSAPVEGQEE